jgi:25S rRNA (uracil2634-N3)-methyltransferase
MSKTKTKRARRELKREGDRKIAAHHKKLVKAAEINKPSTGTKQPAKKKQKMNAPDTKTPETAAKAPVQASQKPRIPFGEYDHILLVGEGDFSFTRSIAIEHGCANVTGTSYDAESEVHEKYPTFENVQSELSELAPPVPLHHGIDATKLSSYKQLRCKREEDNEPDVDEEEEGPTGEGWDTIAFMFPHTGGLSTDVNRQVRVNQALLVGFFKACLDTSTAKRRLAILEAQKQKVCPQALRLAFGEAASPYSPVF